MAITLPKEKIPAETQDAKFLILFSKAKAGKTSAVAQLPNNLIVDTEHGSKFVEALKVEVNSTKEISELLKAIKEAGDPYDFITIDTATMLEEMCKPMALKMYQATPAGEKFTGTDVLTAPNGSGYGFLRAAMEKIIDLFCDRTRHVILTCHARDAAIDKSELTIKQIDLLGKTSRVLSAKADAIGFLTRDDDSNTIVSFNTNDKCVECGARPEHLKNVDVVLGEMQEDGTIKYHWERIFPSLA